MNLEVLANIKANIEELNITEREASFVELELFQRSSRELLKQKVESMKSFLMEQTAFYKQDANQYSDKMNIAVRTYRESIEKIIKTYEKFYVDTFEIRQSARDNQKTCLANICLIEKKKQNCKDKKTLEKYLNMQNYYAQKKLNYTVLINECTARILWCITHMEEDVLSLYNGSTMSIVIPKKRSNLLNRIRMFFYGKSYYRQFLDKLLAETLPKIVTDTQYKINLIAANEKGFLKQVKAMNKQIQTTEAEKAA